MYDCFSNEIISSAEAKIQMLLVSSLPTVQNTYLHSLFHSVSHHLTKWNISVYKIDDIPDTFTYILVEGEGNKQMTQVMDLCWWREKGNKRNRTY